MLTLERGKLAWRYGLGVAGLRPDDVWLAVFPKSGSSWLRFILLNVINLSEQHDEEVDLRALELMPVLGDTNLLKKWPYQTLPRFIKTHRSYQRPLFSTPQRCVHLVRDPRDVMISYYHMAQARTIARGRFEGTFAEFIRHPRFGLTAWMEHHESWKPHATVTLAYEALLRDTPAELARMFEILQIDVSKEVLEASIEQAAFDRMKKMEKTKGLDADKRFQEGFNFMRSGRAKQWPDYFSEADLDLYRSLSQQYGIQIYQDQG